MEGMIILYQGRMGSGKTLGMTADAIDFYKAGWIKIYANYTLNLPFPIERITEEFLLNLDKNSDIKNCVILIDELQIFFDARLWKQKGHIGFSHFIQQLRKRGIILIGTTQYSDTVEKRIRQNITILVRPSYDEKDQILKRIYYDLTSLEDAKKPSYAITYIHVPTLFDCYNTEELL